MTTKMTDLKKSYDEYISRMESKSPKTEINKIRTRFRNDAISKVSTIGCGIYGFNMPTSSGKTITTIGSAIEHSLRNGMERIVYVSPFLTILDQTVNVLKGIFSGIGDDVVCEDHSNYHGDSRTRSKHKLDCDTWNENSIIATTSVNLLNTFYSSHGSELRKFHNMSKTVFILDEIQQIGKEHWCFLNETLNFLCRLCGCSVFACTATMPIMYDKRLVHRLKLDFNIVSPTKDELEVFESRYVINDLSEKECGIEDVVNIINSNLERIDTFLVVTNTKRESRELYDLLSMNNIHGAELILLNTNFHKIHRLRKITRINDFLSNGKGGKLVCISTSMIEAGVDVSFQSGIRYAGGEDNIMQVAGRINRHGTFKKEDSILSVVRFSDVDEHLGMMKSVMDSKNSFLANRKNRYSIGSDESMRGFYKIREFGGGSNEKSAIDRTNRVSEYEIDRGRTAYSEISKNLNYRTVSDDVKVIPDNNVLVIVNQDNYTDRLVRRYISISKSNDPDVHEMFSILKKLTDYSISVVGHRRDIGEMCVEMSDGVFVLNDFSMSYYNENTGFTFTVDNDSAIIL